MFRSSINNKTLLIEISEWILLAFFGIFHRRIVLDTRRKQQNDIFFWKFFFFSNAIRDFFIPIFSFSPQGPAFYHSYSHNKKRVKTNKKLRTWNIKQLFKTIHSQKNWKWKVITILHICVSLFENCYFSKFPEGFCYVVVS